MSSIPARVAGLAVVMALVVAAFTWPSANLEPRDLPVGVVGAPPPALANIDGLALHRFTSEAAARRAIMDREVYGALAGGTVLVATGASPSVAATISAAAPQARVVDLAPGTRADPRAATLGSLALPMTLMGVFTAALATLTARSARDRTVLVLAAATLAGGVSALLTHTWLDALPGPWLGTAGVVALAVAAVGAAVTGLAAHVGRAGIAVGALLMVLVANPWSGVSSAPELLPEPASTLGQLLPTGAAGNLLRSVAFFDGAGAGGHVLVLVAWAVAGLALIATSAMRARPAAIRRPAVAGS